MLRMNNPIVLDTHVLLWSLLQPEDLPEDIRQRITVAQENSQLLVCSISLCEIAMLKSKRRINI